MQTSQQKKIKKKKRIHIDDMSFHFSPSFIMQEIVNLEANHHNRTFMITLKSEKIQRNYLFLEIVCLDLFFLERLL